MTADSVFVAHAPCPACGSSDALAVYDDHTHCFSCQAHTGGPSATPAPARTGKSGYLVTGGRAQALGSRGLHEATLKHWGYQIAEAYHPTAGETQACQVANYYADGEVVAQKVRFRDKTFTIRGDAKRMTLYGQWLWASTGKLLVVTEGEIDALTVSQLQDLRWPVVSVPNGAQSAAAAFKKNLDFLSGYERVVIMFDMDEPGQKAAQECAMLLAPGKARIAKLPLKDPSELLQAGRGEAVVRAMWDAPIYRPDGIVDSAGALALLETRGTVRQLAAYPHAGLQAMVRGIVPRQLVVVCSGSGQGKTEFARELAYSCIGQGLRIGYVALEESVDRTAVGIVGLHLEQRLHLHADPKTVPGFAAAWEAIITDRVFFYDHFGSMESDTLIAKLRYLRVACAVDIIILDHLSIVVSGMEDNDERKTIDLIMTRLRSLCEETGVAIVCISHLKRPPGTPHEEGGRTSLSHLRGSAAIGQLADVAIGLERDQQHKTQSRYAAIRVLKNRPTGETGIAGWLHYNPDKGRLLECEAPEEASPFGPATNEDY